jgi:light-regulated signal transduction histidine kinase (bacteriophytochrome)
MTLTAGRTLALHTSAIMDAAYGEWPQADAEDCPEPNMRDKEVLEHRIARLEERVEELDAFACSVAHDLRAPLRTVHGYARILEEEHTGEMTAAARGCVSTIVNATRDMQRLIDDLLALCRFDVEPGTMSIVNSPALVDQVLNELLPEKSDRVRISMRNLGNCVGNTGLLRQVWMNLLSNALKFTRERDPALIEIGSTAKNHVITYFVRDNGAGFDVSRARDMFLPFRRFHDQRQFEGQGIGLSIVRRIVARHGGRLWAESSQNEGATFYFTLPRI